MPTAPLRPCAGGCGALVVKGRCPSCAQVPEQYRGTAAQRGYDQTWTRFRPRFLSLLVEAGILPVCGAHLPGGPDTQDSHCQAEGRLTFTSTDGSSLHLDHEPPLEAWERTRPERVCDPSRIQLLCAADHAAKPEAHAWKQRYTPWGGH